MKHKHAPHTPVAQTPAPRQDKPTSMMRAPGSDVDTLHTADQPEESAYGPAVWRNLKDGFLYRHATHPHPQGKTHKGLIERQNDDKGELVHSGLFWEGTEEEWFANFRKE